MRPYALLIVVAGGLLVAADTKDDAIKKDKAALKGTWEVVAMEERGQAAEEISITRIVFGDDKLVVTGIEVIGLPDKKDVEVAYTIDPSQKPAAIDVVPAEGPEKGKKVLAIYGLNKDELKICVAQKAGQERPKRFATTKESVDILLTLKREKK